MSECEYGGPFFNEDSSNEGSNNGIQQIEGETGSEFKNKEEDSRSIKNEQLFEDAVVTTRR